MQGDLVLLALGAGAPSAVQTTGVSTSSCLSFISTALSSSQIEKIDFKREAKMVKVV